MWKGFQATLLADRAFGSQNVDVACARVAQVAQGWGYALDDAPSGFLRRTVCSAMLVARSQSLEGIEEEHLQSLADECKKRYRNLALFVWRVLHELGLIGPPPIAAPTHPDEPPEVSEDVPDIWAEWCYTWFAHSRLKSRRQCFWTLLKAGRWAAAERPEAVDPEKWDVRISAEWCAAVDRMAVGQYGTPGKQRGRAASEQGKPLMPRAKAHTLTVVRGFFRDLQEWGLLPVSFNRVSC